MTTTHRIPIPGFATGAGRQEPMLKFKDPMTEEDSRRYFWRYGLVDVEPIIAAEWRAPEIKPPEQWTKEEPVP